MLGNIYKRFRVPLVIKNSTLYTIATFFQKGVGFLLLPLYTIYLSPSDYGSLNLITSVVGFLSIFFLLSLNGAAGRLHFVSDSLTVQKKYWGTIFCLVCINSVVIGGLFLVLHEIIIDPIVDNIQFWPLMGISLISAILSPAYLFYQQWLQTTEQGRKYFVNLLANFLLTTILNIVFLVYLEKGIMSFILSTFITSILFFIYSFLKIKNIFSLSIDSSIARDAYKYSLPLVPHSLAGYASVMMDRVLLNKLMNNFQVGLYSVANQFGSILNIVTSGVNNAFAPFFFKRYNSHKNINDVYKFSENALIVYWLLSFVIVFISPELIRLMTTDDYSISWQVIPFMCIGYALNGLYYFFSMPLFVSNTGKVVIISALQLLSNFIANYILIPRFGFVGAGVAFVFSQLVSTIVALILSKRFEPSVKYSWLKMYVISFIFSLLIMTIYLIEPVYSEFIRLLVKIFVLIVVISISFIIVKKDIKYIITNIKN